MEISKTDLGIHKSIWHLGIMHNDAFIMIESDATPVPRIVIYNDYKVIELLSEGGKLTDGLPRPAMIIEFASPEILSGFAQMIALTCEQYAKQNNITLPDDYEEDKKELAALINQNLN